MELVINNCNKNGIIRCTLTILKLSINRVRLGMKLQLQCCGVDGPTDYRNFEEMRGVLATPWSCCNTNMMTINRTDGGCTHIYKRGCQHVVVNRTKTILLRIFLVALCSVLLQVS